MPITATSRPGPGAREPHGSARPRRGAFERVPRHLIRLDRAVRWGLVVSSVVLLLIGIRP